MEKGETCSSSAFDVNRPNTPDISPAAGARAAEKLDSAWRPVPGIIEPLFFDDDDDDYLVDSDFDHDGTENH